MFSSARRYGVAVFSLLPLIGLRGVPRMPVTLYSFSVYSCETVGTHDTDWIFAWTLTGSTGGVSWEIRDTAGATDDPSSGNLDEFIADVGDGVDLRSKVSNSGDVLGVQSSTPYYRYFWIRYTFGEGYTDWFPLDANPLNLNTQTGCPA
jgi:hypothetical protein